MRRRKDSSQGLAGVVKNGRMGFINLKGETVIGFDYTYNKLDGDTLTDGVVYKQVNDNPVKIGFFLPKEC